MASANAEDYPSLECAPSLNLKRTSHGSFDVIDVQTVAYPIMFLLSERGSLSKAMFQPDVNHRDGDDTFFNSRTKESDTGKWNPPMIQSYLDSVDPVNHFTENTPITILPYTLWAVEASDRVPLIQSLRTHQVATVPTGTGTYFEGKGIMPQLKASLLTEFEFSRLCQLFGRRWSPEMSKSAPSSGINYSGVVHMEDWLTFLLLFDHRENGWDRDGMDWSNVDNFKYFLDRFPSLGFRYDEKLELRQNINLLSFYIRSITRVRIALPDGQHRGQVVGYFMFANFDIRGNFPLREFREGEWRGFPPSDGKPGAFRHVDLRVTDLGVDISNKVIFIYHGYFYIYSGG